MVFTNDGQNMAEDIRLGDCAVDVGDDNLVRLLPQVDMAPKQEQRLHHYMAGLKKHFVIGKNIMFFLNMK